MKMFREEIKLNSTGGQPSFHMLTDRVRDIVTRSGVQDGICVVYSHHTTCSVITQERALDMSMTGLETMQQDFVDVFEEMIPVCRREGMYLHPGPNSLKFAAEHGEDARGCHNTDAHLRSAIVGRSETLVVIGGKPDLGEFGSIYFVDFDQTRGRNRTVQVQVIGE